MLWEECTKLNTTEIYNIKNRVKYMENLKMNGYFVIQLCKHKFLLFTEKF